MLRILNKKCVFTKTKTEYFTKCDIDTINHYSLFYLQCTYLELLTYNSINIDDPY